MLWTFQGVEEILLSDALMAFLLFIPTLKEKLVSESSC